ncbi:MAG: VWA domain-containing protein [Cyclobacteriaceae bacterium]|nr:VWA domain-containing protein [Cyclobacteriaceae bacterium]
MLVQRQTTISGNLVQLCKFLRTKGFVLGTKEESDALIALTLLPIGNKDTFHTALKSIFAKSKWQFEQFDDLYEEFWEQLKKAVDSKTKELVEPNEDKVPTVQKPSLETLKSWLFNNEPEEEKNIAAYSNLEVLTNKNFGDMSTDEMRLIMALLRKMAKQLAHQKSRLKQRSKRNRYLDLKRTFSRNMRLGGDILKLHFSEPKDKKLKLVLLSDVSKSMDIYSRFFINLIYAFQNSYDRIETFVFSTTVHRVTELLDNHEFNKAFEIISERVPHWSGGTTIGNCMQDFVNSYGHKLLTKKTVVIILSDGWDTGGSSELKQSMRDIYKRSKKVIWLNPLAGNPNFSPDVIGLQSAMPYIDVFESAHNLESLKRAMKHLKTGRRKHLLNT